MHTLIISGLAVTKSVLPNILPLHSAGAEAVALDLEREPKTVRAVLHIFVSVMQANLRQSSPEDCAQARLGAVSFVHRFGSSLNRHIHYRSCILDELLRR
ncbi:MAG: hypothetical protein WAN46_08510 [Gammaproteobacteria bacterium]